MGAHPPRCLDRVRTPGRICRRLCPAALRRALGWPVRARGRAAGPGHGDPGISPSESEEDVREIRGRSRFASVIRRLRGQTLEYFPWVVVSLAVAAIVDVLVSRHWIHVLYGERTWAGALLASLSGLPFYFCSGAELPLAKELLLKGMGSGPATAMLLSVPIANILTFGVVSKWLGPRGAFIYLALCVLFSTLIGELVGALVT